MQTHVTMYCKYYQLQVLYTLFSPYSGPGIHTGCAQGFAMSCAYQLCTGCLVHTGCVQGFAMWFTTQLQITMCLHSTF